MIKQVVPRRSKAAVFVLNALKDLRDSESVTEVTKSDLLRFLRSEYQLPARYRDHVNKVLKNGVAFGVIARHRGRYSLADLFNTAKRRKSHSRGRSRKHKRKGSRHRRRRHRHAS